MNPDQAVFNYAILQFLPYPDMGEFVNVGVLMACVNPCLLDFRAELKMTERMKAMFPCQHEDSYAMAIAALQAEMERAKSSVRDPKTCRLVFAELVRHRESIFRFGEVRTILTDKPRELSEDLFRRYVRMEAPNPLHPAPVAA